MKRFVMAVVLACALTGTTLAGDIPTTDVVSPPPPGNTRTASPGDVPSTDYALTAASPLLTVLLTIIGAL